MESQATSLAFSVIWGQPVGPGTRPFVTYSYSVCYKMFGSNPTIFQVLRHFRCKGKVSGLRRARSEAPLGEVIHTFGQSLISMDRPCPPNLPHSAA